MDERGTECRPLANLMDHVPDGMVDRLPLSAHDVLLFRETRHQFMLRRGAESRARSPVVYTLHVSRLHAKLIRCQLRNGDTLHPAANVKYRHVSYLPMTVDEEAPMLGVMVYIGRFVVYTYAAGCRFDVDHGVLQRKRPANYSGRAGERC